MKTYTMDDFKIDENGVLVIPNNHVEGNLNLTRYKKPFKLPDDLVVDGWLDLEGSGITELPKGLVVGNLLNISVTQIKSIPGSAVLGGNLYASYSLLEYISDNFTVSGDCYLTHTLLKSTPKGLVVGGSLYLPKNAILSEDIKTGGGIGNRNLVGRCNLRNGDYVPGRYIYADYTLAQIKSTKKVGEYTAYIGLIKGKNVISDGTYYAHCDNFRQGINDIIYKRAKDRGQDQYSSLTLDSVLSFEEARAMYRE